MGFQNVPVWDLNESDPYPSISYIHVATATIRRFFFHYTDLPAKEY